MNECDAGSTGQLCGCHDRLTSAAMWGDRILSVETAINALVKADLLHKLDAGTVRSILDEAAR